MGGNGFDFTMDYNSTQRSTCSSCTVIGDNSNYWTPSLFFQHQNGTFESVEQVGGATVYYLQRGATGEKLQAFPPGFRMVAGDPMKRNNTNDFAAQAISYNCLNYNGPANPETGYFPNYNCPDGLRTQVLFPSCWNGKDLDSPDHKSHMSYPATQYNNGPCPAGFPVHFISIFYEIIWSTDKFANQWYGNSQPFVWSNGDPTGYSGHGDFIMGWDENLLQTAIDTCTADSGQVEDCPAFKLTPDAQAEGCIVSPKINEQTSGLMASLPGCNPVQAGPGPATKQTGCGAATTVGQPTTTYSTDLTSQGWSYMGCGLDSVYNRTLQGATYSSDGMTNKNCTDFCTAKGFSIAGTEYSRECYCGNSVPDADKPVPGVIGSCQMTCSGDSSQFCGGYARMSLYQKCTGQDCQNTFVNGPGSASLSLSSSSSISTSATTANSSKIPSSVSIASTILSTISTSSSRSLTSGSIIKPSSTSINSSTTKLTTIPTSTKSASTSTSTTLSRSQSTTSSSKPTYTLSSVNKNLKIPQGWSYTGCFTDNLNPRSLITWSNFNGASMSSTKCVSYCSSQNFAYAGTEYQGQCFCGNVLSQSVQQSDDKCNMSCSGNSSEICGGSALLSVFKKSSGTRRGMEKRHGHGHKSRRGEFVGGS